MMVQNFTFYVEVKSQGNMVFEGEPDIIVPCHQNSPFFVFFMLPWLKDVKGAMSSFLTYLDCADDICLVSLVKLPWFWKTEASRVGPKKNRNKTEIRSVTGPCILFSLMGKSIVGVEQLIYLRSVVSADGDTELMLVAQQRWQQISHILSKRDKLFASSTGEYK